MDHRSQSTIADACAPSASEMRVTAVVVTYNRVELLREVLDSLLSQTRRPNRILVVDNASTDNTTRLMSEYASEGTFEYVRLDCNTGGAGGFNEGMKRAAEAGADWLWCMDDDCVPRPDALERLLEPLLSPSIRCAGWLASRVLWVDGTPCLMNLPVAHPLWIEPHEEHPNLSRLVGTSLVSMLVSANALYRFGLPVREFFIWFDDAEFSRRISAGMPCYLVSNSVVVHKTPANMAPLDFSNLTAGSLWKFRLGVRNECSFHRHIGGISAAMLFSARTIVRLLRAKRPVGLTLSVVAACAKGFFFNYPAKIDFPRPRNGPEPMESMGA